MKSKSWLTGAVLCGTAALIMSASPVQAEEENSEAKRLIKLIADSSTRAFQQDPANAQGHPMEGALDFNTGDPKTDPSVDSEASEEALKQLHRPDGTAPGAGAGHCGKEATDESHEASDESHEGSDSTK